MPVSRLPPDPNPEWLKHLAKLLQGLVRSSDPEALASVREFHPRLGSLSAGTPEAARFSRTDAQLVIARQYGFPGWPGLRRHLDVVATYSRSPHRQPAGPAVDGAGELVDRFLRLSCLNYAGDDPSRRERARRLLAEHPGIATASIHTMAAVGEVEAAARLLETDPAQARSQGGPFAWEPLLYLAYSRLDSTRPEHSTLEVARLLLAHGADPGAGYLWEGLPSPFTALTGAFGRGEGDPPPHQHALALARLLLEAGADANDSQALYNCGLARSGPDDDSHLRLLLQFGLGRGTGGLWHARLAPAHPTPAQLLQDELLNAAARNLPHRVRLVLDHGVDVEGRGTGHPVFGGHTAYQLAELKGHTEIVDLLASSGAAPRTPDPVLALLGACMRADRPAVDHLLSAEPSLLRQAIARQPDLIVDAAEAGRLDAVELMADLGFDVNVIRRCGSRTAPLHQAAWNGDLALLRLLVDRGADPGLRDPGYHSTPRGFAEHNHQQAAAGYLAALERP